jgi:putative membrane protein
MRLLGAVIAAVLVTVFAVVNVDEVEVNWLVGTWSTPLIVVIAVSALFGAALDSLLQVRSRRRAKR